MQSEENCVQYVKYAVGHRKLKIMSDLYISGPGITLSVKLPYLGASASIYSAKRTLFAVVTRTKYNSYSLCDSNKKQIGTIKCSYVQGRTRYTATGCGFHLQLREVLRYFKTSQLLREVTSCFVPTHYEGTMMGDGRRTICHMSGSTMLRHQAKLRIDSSVSADVVLFLLIIAVIKVSSL